MKTKGRESGVKNKVRVTVTMDEDLYPKIKKLAIKNDMKISHYVSKWFREMIKKEK